MRLFKNNFNHGLVSCTNNIRTFYNVLLIYIIYYNLYQLLFLVSIYRALIILLLQWRSIIIEKKYFLKQLSYILTGIR